MQTPHFGGCGRVKCPANLFGGGLGGRTELPMLILLPVLVVCSVSILLVGFILGYGVRAGISRRRRAQEHRRYEMTGSSWLIGRRL